MHERLAWKKKMAHPVEQGSMDYPGNAATPEAPVDFSIGFALAQHPEELETAMQAADRAMYEHKQSREA
jgi:GGDEF domain-containing protein